MYINFAAILQHIFSQNIKKLKTLSPKRVQVFIKHTTHTIYKAY